MALSHLNTLRKSDMLTGLTRENLHGVWAAIPTPFDEQDRVDLDVLQENIRRLHGAGVHGVYTTDSDGEFYAIELDEFKAIVKVLADEGNRLGLPTQAGITWSHTRGMLNRLVFAADQGVLGAHVGHPFFMPMTPTAYKAFWQDIQQAHRPEFGLVHYNTPRVHNLQRGQDYAVRQAEVPSLIGTKQTELDVRDFLSVLADAPQLSHFTGELAMTPFMLFGARGVYSWFANFNPRYILEWYADIVEGRWEAARHRQERMLAFSRAKQVLKGEGNLHGIVNKAMAAASPFLAGTQRTRRPYLPVPDEIVARFRRIVEEQFSDLVWS